ncbi:MAG: hypothetical protein HOE90_15020 [Bacteriovoracaceae bacterium]|jgi:hypothetical protein|nr:hypothetical protein [Bacteriovoracaceae bacterium]
MKLAKALSDKTYDIRLRQKLLGEGKLDKAELNKYLEGLEDDAGKCEDLNAVVAATVSEPAPNNTDY